MTREMLLQFSFVFFGVCGVSYIILSFFIKDIYTQLKIIDSQNKEIKEEQKRIDQRIIETNKRLDSVYTILFKTLGK